MQPKKKLADKNILFFSQVRTDSVNKIPGKAFHEAKTWSKHFNKVLFLCFSETRQFYLKAINENFVLISIPFDTSESLLNTIFAITKNYIRSTLFLFQIIRKFKIDIIREENLILCGFSTFLVSLLTGVPYSTWLGGLERKAMQLKYGNNLIIKILKRIIYAFEILILKNSKIVYTVSKEIFDSLNNISLTNKYLTPNFIDLNIFEQKDYPTNLSSKKIKLFYSGRFEIEKGLDDLLEAINIISSKEKNKNFELMLAGYGSLKNIILSYIKEHDLQEYVSYKGKFQYSELPPLYREADVFIIPSKTEGLPAALLEAMASGCACICTQVGMIPSYIETDENGILVPPNQPKQLANAIVQLLNNPNNIIEYGKKNREIIEKASSRYIDIHKFFFKSIFDSKV